MEIGTYIRAFDFNTTDSCYMEGKIIAVDDDSKTLTVKTTDVVLVMSIKSLVKFLEMTHSQHQCLVMHTLTEGLASIKIKVSHGLNHASLY